MVTIFMMIVMATLMSKHIKELFGTSKVFPFISLTLTPLIALHALAVDSELAEVVKFLIERLSYILTFDLFDFKSAMTGSQLKIPSLALIGY